MNKPKVSIIVPCYGVEKYLDRCMESIVNQTLKDIEIILVDDGSPDRVPQMCDNQAKKDSRIKVIHKKNAGLGYARNSGLDIATGEYVAFVDSDDFVDSKMYETLYDNAKNENADAVFCGYKKEVKGGRWLNKSDFKSKTTLLGDDIFQFVLGMIASAPYEKAERLFSMSVWHSLYKKQIIDSCKIEFVSERDVAAEDLPFQCDFMNKAKRVLCIPDCYYYYCLNSSSLTVTFKSDKYIKYKRLCSVILEKLGDSIEIRERVCRMFIGYTRMFVLRMFYANIKNKNYILKQIVNDDIWISISKEYKPAFLPFYQRLHYKALLLKNIPLLKVITILVKIIKKK